MESSIIQIHVILYHNTFNISLCVQTLWINKLYKVKHRDLAVKRRKVTVPPSHLIPLLLSHFHLFKHTAYQWQLVINLLGGGRSVDGGQTNWSPSCWAILSLPQKLCQAVDWQTQWDERSVHVKQQVSDFVEEQWKRWQYRVSLWSTAAQWSAPLLHNQSRSSSLFGVCLEFLCPLLLSCWPALTLTNKHLLLRTWSLYGVYLVFVWFPTEFMRLHHKHHEKCCAQYNMWRDVNNRTQC